MERRRTRKGEKKEERKGAGTRKYRKHRGKRGTGDKLQVLLRADSLYLQNGGAVFHNGWAVGDEKDCVAIGGEEIGEELALGVWIKGAGSLVE